LIIRDIAVILNVVYIKIIIFMLTISYTSPMIKVMFVCLGNICRSPLAEAVMAKRIVDAGLSSKITVASCGTAAYHIGENPDPRTIAVSEKYRIPIDHKAQQLSSADYITYNYLLVMDDSNAINAEKVKPREASAQVFKLRDFDTEDEGSDVADPWFGKEDGFEVCYKTVERCTAEFLHFLVNKHNLIEA
jgi:protein-tyrosine phosphatase